MSQDYHIYLHSNEGSSLASNTQPKEESMGGVFSAKNTINDVQKFANSGFSSMINTGTAALSKAIPFVAVAVVGAKVADKVLSVGFHHLESYTGNYQFSMEYNNFKTIMGYVVNPVSLFKKQMQIHFEQQKFNNRQKEYRTLMGESFIGV